MVILFFSNNFARRRAGKVLVLRRLYTTFHKKAVFFFGGKNFGYVNVACNFGLVWPCFVILGMIMIDVSTVTVEVLFLVSSRKVLSSQTDNSGIC